MQKKIECDADSFPVTSAQNIAWQNKNIAWLTKLILILCHASNWKLQKQQTSVDCINKNIGYIIFQYNRHRYTCNEGSVTHFNFTK